MSALAVGVLLAGAEPEELITAVTAASQGRPGIAVGDAIGLADGQLSRTEGLGLVVVYVALVAFVWHRERQPPAIGELGETLDKDEDEDESVRAGVGLLLAVGGIAVMALGGVLAVRGAERVVEALSATDTAVGLTLVALATTAELLALVWSSARRNVSELAIAPVVGSAAYNATATLGAAAIVHPTAHVDVRAAAVLAAALPLVVLLLGGPTQRLPRAGGVALVAAYALFVTVTLR